MSLEIGGSSHFSNSNWIEHDFSFGVRLFVPAFSRQECGHVPSCACLRQERKEGSVINARKKLGEGEEAMNE